MDRDVQQMLEDLQRRVQELEQLESCGRWNPADASGATLVLTVAAATWLRYGQLVAAHFAISMPVTASAATLKIGGLPFKCEPVATNSSWPVVVSLHQFAAPLSGLVDSGTNTMRFADQAGTLITNAAYSGKSLRGAAIYRTKK